LATGERLAGRARVLDGETVVVDGIPVRLKGVAAPEVAHYDKSGEPGGGAAKEFMVELAEGHVVVCEITLTGMRSQAEVVAGNCIRACRIAKRQGATVDEHQRHLGS
jgi:endonuclease YncB( thermonuclease family)